MDRIYALSLRFSTLEHGSIRDHVLSPVRQVTQTYTATSGAWSCQPRMPDFGAVGRFPGGDAQNDGTAGRTSQ